MAITIGAFKIDFEANTKPLQDAKKMIQDWSKAVTAAGRSTTSAGIAQAKQWGAQEIAMKKAWIQMQRQVSAMRKISAALPEGSAAQAAWNQKITETTGLMRRYAVELTSGTLSSHQMARASLALQNELQKVGDATRKAGAAISGGKFGKLTDTLRNLESASVLAVGPLSGIGARLRSLSAITSRTTLAMAAMFGTVTGLAVGFYKLATASIRANAAMAQVEARLLAVSGDANQVGKDIKYLTNLAMSMGLEFVGTAKSFSRFNAAAMGTALEGDKAKTVFEGISRAGAALRLSGVEMEGIFRAVEQMMSKGTVQAEELRGQLGERLPGAFRLAAEAMGVNTIELNKMLKNGEVLAEDMLPKLSALLEKTFGPRAASNADTLAGAWNNLITQFTLFANEVNDSIGLTDALVAVIKDLTEGMKDLAGDVAAVIEVFGKFAAVVKNRVGPALWAWGQIAGGIVSVARVVGLLPNETDNAMKGMTAAVLNAINPWDRLKKIAEDVQATIDSFRFFSADFQKNIVDGANGIQELVDAADQLALALTLVAKGRKFETAMEEAAWAAKLAGKATGDLTQVSAMLATQYQIYVIPTAAGVAQGLAELAERIRETTDVMEDGDKATEKYADALFELGQLHRELAAAKQGEEAYDLYDKIVSKIEDQVRTLREVGVDEQLIADYAADRLATEIAITAELEKHKIAADRHKDIIKAEAAMVKEQNSLYERQEKALTKANQAIDVMAMRIAAMASGPDSLEIFEKIQQPLEQFVFQLEQADVEATDIVARAKEFEALLQEQLRLTGPIAKGMEDIADSMGDAMESLFTGAKTLKDTFKDMAEEIYKSLAHLLIIDPLVKQIGNSLTSTFTQGTNGQVPSIFSPGGLFGKKAPPQGTPGTTANTTGVLKAGMNQPDPTALLRKQEVLQGEFKQIIDDFDVSIEEFREAITMMHECVCSGGGGEGGSGMTEAADALFRSSQEMGTTAYDLDSASGDLKNASYSLENTARSFEAAAMKEQQLAKADKWMNLIQTGISAYGAMSSMGGKGGDTAGSLTTASSSEGRTSLILGDNPNGMTPVTYSGMSMDEVNAILPGRARGGPTMRGGMYQVAEDGPELYHEGNKSYLLAGNDGQVEPIGGRGGREGGNTTNITIVMPQQTTNRTAAQNARAIGKEQSRVMGRNS